MMDIKGKKITVIGAVRSGIGAAKLIKKAGGIPFVSDLNSNEKIQESVKILKDNNIEFETGGHTSRIYNCDLMIVSPGVPLDSPIIVESRKRKISLISEIELAYNFCKGRIIAVTGTNGKTTTTALIGHIFSACGKKTYTAGNIGIAFSEIALDVKEDEFVALEVSSFQLDLIDSFKPDVGIILNITPDHLYRYNNDFNNYIYSKFRIFKNHDAKDNLIINKDDPVLMDSLIKRESKTFYFSLKEPQMNGCYLSGDQIFCNIEGDVKFTCSINDIFIKGEHNIANAMAAVMAGKIFKLNNNKIIKGLKTFPGVEHRLEFVREIDGVKYINDSKATNVDSVWYALRSFDTPLFLILGGQDEGNDYNKIKELVTEKVQKIYAIGSSSAKVFNFFHSFVKVEVKNTLEEAVIAANLEARENDIVLLSPACKSFDQFNSYEHRGKVFKEAVNKL